MSINRRKSVIVDIDGTLANADHRMPLVLEPEAYPGAQQALRADADWPAFWAALDKDAPEPAIIALTQAMKAAGYPIVLFTARPDAHRAVTEAWLARHAIAYNALLMRPAGDERHDLAVKAEMLGRANLCADDVLFVVEDRQAVVGMWRGMGIKCLQCAPGNH